MNAPRTEQELDVRINALFREQDRLKALGQGGADPSAAYMAVLFELRDCCRARSAALTAKGAE